MSNIKEELLLSVARDLVDEYISGCTFYSRHQFGNGSMVVHHQANSLPGGIKASPNNKPKPEVQGYGFNSTPSDDEYRDMIGSFLKSHVPGDGNRSHVNCGKCGFKFEFLTDTPHTQQQLHNQLLAYGWASVLGNWHCQKCANPGNTFPSSWEWL